MPITATSYEAQIEAAVVNMLAASATFQALVGAANATAARSFIVADDGGQATAGKCVDGSALNVSATHFIVRAGPLRRIDRAFNTYGAEGECGILGVLTITAGELATDSLTRARNAAGGIRADLEAMFGTVVNGAPAIVAGRFESPAPEICDTTGPLRGRIYVFLDLSWRDIP